jgi:hypothetical protein
MTIRLNRINVEIRENLGSEVKDDKVSRKAEVDIENKMNSPFLKDEKEKQNDRKKKFFTVSGVKSNNNIEIEAERRQGEFTEMFAGIFIDKMK